MTENDQKAESHLNVAVAHVVLVPLQSEVSVLRVNETNQGLAVPPSLSVEAQSDTPSATHMHVLTPPRSEKSQISLTNAEHVSVLTEPHLYF